MKIVKQKITQKSIKDQISQTEKEIADLRDIRKNLPEYVALEKKLYKMREDYFDSVHSSINAKEDDVRMLKQQLKRIKAEKELELPERVQHWFDVYERGVNWGYGGIKVVWISDDGRWVIITNKGGTAGTGTAMGTGGYYYAASTHWLSDTHSEPGYSSRIYLKSREEDKHGMNYTSNKFGEFEGRLTKEKKQALIDLIPDLEKDIIVTKIWSYERKRNV